MEIKKVDAEIEKPEMSKVNKFIEEILKTENEDIIGEFEVSTILEKGTKVRANMRNFSLIMDEPEIIGGSNEGPKPAEIVLAALGSCMEILYGIYAGLMNISLQSVKMTMKSSHGNAAMLNLKDGNSSLSSIEIKVEISSNASGEEIQKLNDIVVHHSPIFNTLLSPIPISGNFYLNGSKIQEIKEKYESKV